VGSVAPGAFVDVHSHAVPSDDDGAQTLDEALWLARDAGQHGTRLLFATPHVWPSLTLTEERERRVRLRFAELREQAPIEVRLGWELTPHHELLDEDLWRYELPGTGAVLIEVPFSGPADLLFRCLDRLAAQGLDAVIAHPERTEAVQDEPALLGDLAGRGRLLQVNATSLLGHHGPVAEELGWRLVDSGGASLVASDGHRPTRPARLDAAYELAATRVGETAERLFDGSALGLAARTQPAPSRAASTGA
jgi:protein-tyrosine phosphatase